VDDEMPAVFSVARAVSMQVSGPEVTPVDTGPTARDDLCLRINDATQLAFTFAAGVAPPTLTVDPSLLDYGCVLAGEAGRLSLTLRNASGCTIGFVVTAPGGDEWVVTPSTGIVEENAVEVTVQITLPMHTALAEILTITSWWAQVDGNRIPDLAETVCYLPVYAVFDRPIISVDRRVIDLGEVFPTVSYSGSMTISLLNSFPTDFEFLNYDAPVEIDFTPDDRAGQSSSMTFPELTRTLPPSGHLECGESLTITVQAQFCGLGKRALPFSCCVLGASYHCVVLANVVPPRVRVLTGLVEFSADFTICKRSQALVRLENECTVPSSARLEMIDSCRGVFSLDDTDPMEVVDSVKFRVGCYSEIHGDYCGKLRLVIRDPWQLREIEIPTHVKALGSFFAFQKHTLGYRTSPKGDYITFGEAIPKNSEPVIRRITLANFSSETIEVDWTIANLVKGRRYADLAIRIMDNGDVTVTVDETAEANVQDPFHMACSRTTVEKHGKTIVIVEFIPKEAGTFAGCLVARRGEFIHTVGLTATVLSPFCKD
jgi:hypothetical protein